MSTTAETVQAGKLPPQAPEMERAVLGAALLDHRAMADVGFLKPEHFYVDAHRRIWKACLALYEAGHPVDILTVTDNLKRSGELDIVGGAYYIAELTRGMASPRNIEYHARIVVQEFVAREVIRTGEASIRDGYSSTEDAFDVAERAENRVAEMIRDVAVKTGTSLADLAREELAGMDEPKKPVHSTGFEALDKALGGGWSDGDLIIVAGRPGMGKSSFAFSSILWSAQQGHSCGLFSLELGARKTNARLQSINTGIHLGSILGGKLTDGELAKLHQAHANFVTLPVYLNFNNGITVAELKSETARMVKRHGITALFIDQLYWIKPPDRAKDPVAAVTRVCKNIAMEFGIPVILLHQLSRALVARKGSMRPELTDLRDSGAAEQDAQVVIFPHRPEYYGIREDDKGSTADRADIIIAKNSNGPLDTIPLRFDAYCTAFRDAAPTAFKEDEPMPF